MNADPRMLLMILAAIIAVCFAVAQSTRTMNLPRQWARANGYELLNCEYRSFFKGPFFLAGKSDRIYRISVKLPDGEYRYGYLRCRASVLGVFPDVTEPRWDAEAVHQPAFPVVVRDNP